MSRDNYQKLIVIPDYDMITDIPDEPCPKCKNKHIITEQYSSFYKLFAQLTEDQYSVYSYWYCPKCDWEGAAILWDGSPRYQDSTG